MLIEFSIANFRSFREKQTLSMVAAPRLKRTENTFVPEVVGEKFPRLLKVAVIYGPNASGKSNLVRAIDALFSIAKRTPTAEASPLPVSPFRFDPALAEAPSEFEVHFIAEGVRYSFELAATRSRITTERLTRYSGDKAISLYKRAYEEGGDRYTFSDLLEGGPDVHETWRKLTGPQVLFLTQAVANSSEELRQLKPPHAWLSEMIFCLLGDMRDWVRGTQNVAVNHETWSKDIASFLQEVDIPVSEFRVERPGDDPGTKLENGLAAMGKPQGESLLASAGRRLLRTTLTHRSALGSATFSLAEESDGTRNLIGFWLPWSVHAVNQEVLVVDELDSSLHPEIVRALVAKYLKREQPSQLIFTTHDTHLMDAKLLRRDQFWLTERDENGATQLRSIHDFEGREGEDIEKRYFEGRYRGLPLLSSD